jgi:multiple antibiotic resistance protein
MEQYIQAAFTLLSLINPVICGALFAEAAAEQSAGARIGNATKAAVVVAVILSFAAIFGASLLKLFGISLDAFQFAGGTVLVWMGFLMLRGEQSPTATHEPQNGTAALIPLILFAASPGTITGVITLSVAHTRSDLPVTTLAAVVIAVAVTWVVMIVAASSARHKQGLMHDVTTRFMGLIVLAMGVQFALSGLKAFFAV